MLSFIVCLLLPMAQAVSWNMDNCPLEMCECIPRLGLINCRNQNLHMLDLSGLARNSLDGARVLDLRYNELTLLPNVKRLREVFPDVKEIHLAHNPQLSCHHIDIWRQALTPLGIEVTDSMACVLTLPSLLMASTTAPKSLLRSTLDFLAKDVNNIIDAYLDKSPEKITTTTTSSSALLTTVRNMEKRPIDTSTSMSSSTTTEPEVIDDDVAIAFAPSWMTYPGQTSTLPTIPTTPSSTPESPLALCVPAIETTVDRMKEKADANWKTHLEALAASLTTVHYLIIAVVLLGAIILITIIVTGVRCYLHHRASQRLKSRYGSMFSLLPRRRRRRPSSDNPTSNDTTANRYGPTVFNDAYGVTGVDRPPIIVHTRENEENQGNIGQSPATAATTHTPKKNMGHHGSGQRKATLQFNLEEENENSFMSPGLFRTDGSRHPLTNVRLN